MSLLTPLFLAGAVAIAFPIVFHLIRRTTREKTIFSSLMFLMPSPPRLTRRSRLEHLLLLAVRCLVLCLLALGFSRPFLKKPMNVDAGDGASRRVVLLMDTSASMRRVDLWREAVSKAEGILHQTSPGDEVAVLTFDRSSRSLMNFEEWKAAPMDQRAAIVLEKLRRTSPGWGSTHLSEALISAAETLADSAAKPFNGRRQIVLISDLQEGSRLEQLQGYEWPKGVEVDVEVVKVKSPGNAGIQLAGDVEDGPVKGPTGVRVRIINAPESKREQFKVGWAQDGGTLAGPQMEVYVPPGQSRIATVPAPDSVLADRIRLTGDDEDFDNTVFVIPPQPEKSTVLYLGEDSPNNPRQPLYFLQRAFQETKRRSVQVQVRTNGTLLSPGDGEAATLVVVSSELSEERARAVKDWLRNGKTVLAVLTSERMAPTLSTIMGLGAMGLQETKPVSYALLGEIDFQNPLFAPFADPRFSGFSGIHFWRYRRIDPGAIPGSRTVARFDSGDPAILEVGIEKGRLVIFTFGWHPEDSQLALSTKFVPLLYGLLEQNATGAGGPPQYHVGDSVPLAAVVGAANAGLEITSPDRSVVKASGETNFSGTLAPGIYTIKTPQGSKRFAVNLDPAESRTRALPVDELERLGAPMAQPVLEHAKEIARKGRIQNSELENRQKLWRWFIVGTLMVLLIETWLAGRTARVEGTVSSEA